jgi:hypothetical protein
MAASAITCALAGAQVHRFSLGPVDDAYISLRYAGNWAAGRGLCFNPHEKVEGYTNFLLVSLEASAIRCGVPPEAAMSGIGWASLILMAGTCAWFAGGRFRRRPVLAVAATVVVVGSPMYVCWALSGLETGPYALLVFATVVAAARSSRPGALCGVALLLSLAAMTRPEAVSLLPVVALVVFLKNRSLRSVLIVVLAFSGMFGTYFLLRALHFGYAFPNTFYAKLDYGSVALLKRGMWYVFDFLLAAPLMVLPAILTLAILRSAPLWVTAMALAVLVQLSVVAFEGGDHFAMFRFLVPVLPLLGCLAIYFSTHLARRVRASRRTRAAFPWLMVAGLALSAITVGRSEKHDSPNGILQLDHFAAECDLAREWASMGRWLADRFPPSSTVCTVAIGAIAFYSDLTVVDPHGITDSVIAHQPMPLGTGYAGHEKFDLDYVFAREPTVILPVHPLTPLPVREDRLELAAWGEFNHAVLRDARLWARYEYRRFSLEGGYLNMFVRRR